MSEEVNKEQTKGAEQEITELSDEQLDEAAAGAAPEGRELVDKVTQVTIRRVPLNPVVVPEEFP